VDEADGAELAVFFFAGHGAVSMAGTKLGKHILQAKCWKKYQGPRGFERVSVRLHFCVCTARRQM
jgi:hypothetical protein